VRSTSSRRTAGYRCGKCGLDMRGVTGSRSSPDSPQAIW